MGKYTKTKFELRGNGYSASSFLKTMGLQILGQMTAVEILGFLLKISAFLKQDCPQMKHVVLI